MLYEKIMMCAGGSIFYIFRINDDISSQGKLHFLNFEYFEKLDGISSVILNPYFNFLMCTLYCNIFRTSIFCMITLSLIAG